MKYSNSDLPIRDIALQIKSRKKAKNKLKSWYHTENILFPAPMSVEQSSSEITAQYKATILNGKSITDLTGGFGVDTYYFSKAFFSCNYVESNHELAEIVKHNLSVFKQDNVNVYTKTAECYLSEDHEMTDVYFIDPSRRDDQKNRVYLLEDCRPNLSLIIPKLLRGNRQVMVKLSPLLDIKKTLDEFPQVTEVHVVSFKNECKELLFILESNRDIEPEIKTIDLWSDQKFDFKYSNEESAVANLLDPMDYLYEPNSSILKAGAFKVIADHFKVNKINVHSHLYSSKHLIDEFPGRKFKIQGSCSVSRKELQDLINGNKCNLAIRNFPTSIVELKKKLKISDGGDHYVFATTLQNGSKRLIVTKKVK